MADAQRNRRDPAAIRARHSLVVQDLTVRIRLMRVDLVKCDSAFGNIQLFM